MFFVCMVPFRIWSQKRLKLSQKVTNLCSICRLGNVTHMWTAPYGATIIVAMMIMTVMITIWLNCRRAPRRTCRCRWTRRAAGSPRTPWWPGRACRSAGALWPPACFRTPRPGGGVKQIQAVKRHKSRWRYKTNPLPLVCGPLKDVQHLHGLLLAALLRAEQVLPAPLGTL